MGPAKEAGYGSPKAKSLASDLRQFSLALQESPEAADVADVSSTSLASCSNPNQSRDLPHGRRTAGAAGASRELFALNQLRGQCESQRRRLTQLERRMEVQLEDRLQGKGDLRERWAETQGTVTGLLEDVQCLRQRLDMLDQRRNEPVKDTEKRFNELNAQLQAIEHQSRMSQSALDEFQRRQVARQRRWEQSLEELHSRVAGELAQHRSGSRSQLRPSESPTDARLRKLEERQDFSETALAALQMQVEEGLRRFSTGHPQGGGEAAESTVSERGLMALERKTSGQIQDLSSAVAGLRVRVDGQLQRMSALADRLESSASSSGLVALRTELAQRSQEQQRCETEMAVLRNKMQDFAESCDDSIADIKEVVRKAMAELASLQQLPNQLEAMQAEFVERLAVQVPPMHLGPPLEPMSLEGMEANGRDGRAAPMPPCYEVNGLHNPPGLELGAGSAGMAHAWEVQSTESELSQRYEYEAATELHALAGHLLAADALAARVVQLEEDAGQTAVHISPEEVEQLHPWQVKLYRLSNEVGELQARLLSTRLQRELQVEAMLPDEMMPEGRLDLLGQERELRELEQQVIELEQAFSPDEAPALQWEEPGDAARGPEDTDLADLADRLEPLERAFRAVAERLNCLPGLVQSLAGQNGEPVSLDELLSKVELGPELGPEVDLGAKAAPQEVKALVQQVSSHQEEIVNLRADVEELQSFLRKATGSDAESSVSPLVKARGKLDLLCAEMAELQSRMRDTGPREKCQERPWSNQGDEVVGPGPRNAGLGGSPPQRGRAGAHAARMEMS